jgi:ribosomal-protein-serine acetyltransferase
MIHLQIDDRTELKLLQLHHADEVYTVSLENRAFLSTWLPWVDDTHTSEDTLTFIASELEKFAARRGMSFGIWSEGQFAGNVSFNSIDTYHRKAEIGYWLAEKFTARGIMTRACNALLSYAFGELRLHRIEIRSAVDNTRSRLIPERLGFQQEGIVRGVERMGERYVDHVIYGLLAEEWAVRSPRT